MNVPAVFDRTTRIFARPVRFATQFLVLGLVFAIPLPAQVPTTAVWHGYLRNSASAPVINAKVRLTGAATAEASTAPDGAFTLPALPPGKYKLTVEAEGRTASYAEMIDLQPAAPAVVVTLSDRGELTLTAPTGQTATGGQQLSSQAVSELLCLAKTPSDEKLNRSPDVLTVKSRLDPPDSY